MLAVGISRRTLRKPQALNGALRQFESVTSRSGAGGKSSISRQRSFVVPYGSWQAPTAAAREPDHFSASGEPGCGLGATEHIAAKEAGLAAKIADSDGTKERCCRAVTVARRSTLRHCREATKLRPRCLIDVAATTIMGNHL